MLERLLFSPALGAGFSRMREGAFGSFGVFRALSIDESGSRRYNRAHLGFYLNLLCRSKCDEGFCALVLHFALKRSSGFLIKFLPADVCLIEGQIWEGIAL
jgi:hypothetical protein